MADKSFQEQLADFAAAKGFIGAKNSEPKTRVKNPLWKSNEMSAEPRKKSKINIEAIVFNDIGLEELKRIYLSWAEYGRTQIVSKKIYFVDDHTMFQRHLDRLCKNHEISQENDFYCRVGYYCGRKLQYDKRSPFCQSVSISAGRASFKLKDDPAFKRALRRVKDIFDSHIYGLARCRILAYVEEQREKEKQKQIDDSLGRIIYESIDALNNLKQTRIYMRPSALSSQDIQLARNWRRHPSGDGKDLEGNTSQDDSDRELGRVLSARVAEKAAAEFYRGYGKKVIDVSITQISDQNNFNWRLFDLDVDGCPVDVKNSRRSKNSHERYTDHCVPKFKQDRRSGIDITITGMLSDYIPTDRFLDDDYLGSPIMFLGELTYSKIKALQDYFQDETLILDFSFRSKSFLPPWVFELPEFTSAGRSGFAKKPLPKDALDKSLWQMSGHRPLPIFIAKGMDLRGVWNHAEMAAWQWKFYNELRCLPYQYRFSLPFIFMSVLKNFIKNVILEDTEPGYHPQGYREFLYFSEKESFLTVPIFTLDPLKIVDELITSLSTLWQGNHKLIREFKQFKLVNYNILLGKMAGDDQQWKTLIAYCGGWDPMAKCGKNPLVLGTHLHCSHCGKLICDTCGYCSDKCPQMKIEGRNELGFKGNYRKFESPQFFHP